LALKNAEDRETAKVHAAGLEGEAHKTALKQVMPASVAYVKPLLAKFGVAKVSDLPKVQFAEFMKVSESYVQGTAVND
jgi:UDP-N-acetylglucosamine enolpyruvyl transferase